MGEPDIRIDCPVCGGRDSELFEAGDGEWGSRAVSHIDCVCALEKDIQEAERKYTTQMKRAEATSAHTDELHRRLDKSEDELRAMVVQYERRGQALLAIDAELKVLKEENRQFSEENASLFNRITANKKEPWLGLATTEMLLEELLARAQVGGYASYKTVGDDYE